ncbi:MAG: hypothetical protein KJ579_01010 [Verrucomicrobia bacterium]|nr:hypothetical protein [Verrucomicrobiota bacterium]
MNIENGYGQVISATTTPERVVFNALARSVNLYNRGTAAIALNINCETAAFAEIYAAAKSIRVEAGQAFAMTFDVPTIASLVLRVDGVSGTATVNLGAY